MTMSLKQSRNALQSIAVNTKAITRQNETAKPTNTQYTHTNIMTNENTYNGWTNYATWKVNLEMFDGHDSTDGYKVTPEDCQNYANAVLLENETEGNLVCDYSPAFLEDVNWSEIAETINENV